jgi:anti-sigma B factor antagonist
MQLTAPSSDFCCEVRPDRERAVVALAGELDLSVAAHVAATAEELLDVGFAHVVIDLRELSFLDSAGVHALVSAHRSAGRRGAALSLVRGPQRVQCVLTLTGTDSLFSFDGDGGGA